MLKIKHKNELLQAVLSGFKRISVHSLRKRKIAPFSNEQQRIIEEEKLNQKRIQKWLNKSCDLKYY